jgi:hypothetical protein
MKPSIQERMQRQINLATTYNTLFDLIVETTETSFSATATNPADNQYNVLTESLQVNVICNDNEYNTISVFIYNPAVTENVQIGVLQININGDMDESMHNTPRALRRAVNDYIDDVYDALDSWIDDQTNGGDE